MKTSQLSVAFVALFGAGAAAVACASIVDEDDSASSSVTLRGELTVPTSADLTYAVSGGVLGQVEPIGTDRISFRPSRGGRAVSLTEDRELGAITADLSTDDKGFIDYGRSTNPIINLDLFSVPATQTSSWTPLNGLVVNDALAARRTGALATILVHELAAVADVRAATGRAYRVVFAARRRVIENDTMAMAEGTTNSNWPFRNVVVARGVADYFVPSGSTTATLVRSAEYRLLGDELQVTPTKTLEEVATVARSGETYLDLRCLKGAAPLVKTTLAALPKSGLAIDDCSL